MDSFVLLLKLLLLYEWTFWVNDDKDGLVKGNITNARFVVERVLAIAV